MGKSLKALLVAAGVSAGLFGAQGLMAHEGSGGTMGGGMMGMMGMMGQMGQMMDGCNKMMQEHRYDGESQKPAQPPTQEGERQGSGDIMEMMGRMNVMRPMSQMVGTWR